MPKNVRKILFKKFSFLAAIIPPPHPTFQPKEYIYCVSLHVATVCHLLYYYVLYLYDKSYKQMYIYTHTRKQHKQTLIATSINYTQLVDELY